MIHYTAHTISRLQFARVLSGVMLVVILGGCGESQSEFELLASRFSMAAEKLELQKTETLIALQEASTAQVVAVAQPEFNFQSAQTLEFVQKWQRAGGAVSQLRIEIGNTVTSCYEMLDGLLVRAQAINDDEIRTKTVEYVENRRLEFDRAVQQTEAAVLNMENAMRLGDDIIESLRIVGTANLVSQKIEELQAKQKEAIDSFPNVDNIIQEGKKFLNIEFGQEIFT